MVWSSVADKQAISYNTLQEACDARIFAKIGNIPAPGKTGSQMVTADQIQALVEIEPAPLVGVPNNELVVKEQVIPVSRTYYQLSPCPGNPLGTAWTRLVPTRGVGHRYILFGGTFRYWTYTGVTVGPQTTIPTGYDASIQRQDASNCP
jgi:hypothetical protein